MNCDASDGWLGFMFFMALAGILAYRERYGWAFICAVLALL
jgi:hypothetical protein